MPKIVDKPVIKSADMNEDLKAQVIDLAVSAANAHEIEKDIAATLKKELDTKFGRTWHVIVGKNFGSYVTHEAHHFIYFYIGPLAFLIFKIG